MDIYIHYLAIQNVVGNFGTNEETLLTKDRVDTEVGLFKIKLVKFNPFDTILPAPKNLP